MLTQYVCVCVCVKCCWSCMVVLERWNQPVLGDGFFALDLHTNRLRCFDAQMHTVNCKNLSHCNHGSFVKMTMEDQGSQRMTILDQWDGPTLALSSISTRCICSRVECSWIFNQETALLHLLTWQQYATQSKPFHSFSKTLDLWGQMSRWPQVWLSGLSSFFCTA